MKYITAYYHTAMKHYEMTRRNSAQNKSYEFYSDVSKYIARHGMDSAAKDFAALMPWGRRPKCSRNSSSCRRPSTTTASWQLQLCRDAVRRGRAQHQVFAKHVMPELKRWKTAPMPEPAELKLSAEPARAA